MKKITVPQRTERLSPRQREVLRHLAHGLSNAEIGEQLGLSKHTIKVHVAQVLAKMGVRNRTEAAMKFMEMKR